MADKKDMEKQKIIGKEEKRKDGRKKEKRGEK